MVVLVGHFSTYCFYLFNYKTSCPERIRSELLDFCILNS